MATHLSRYRAVAPARVDGRPAERLFVTVARAGSTEPPIEAVLRDVSPFGCRLTMASGYEPGARLALRIGGGMDVAASVVWSDDEAVGCRFDGPVSGIALRRVTLSRT